MIGLNVIEKYLTPNPYSRCGLRMEKPLGLVYHWVAAPGAGAETIWHYFENLKNQQYRKGGEPRKASAHFIIDLDGSVLQLIPLEEIAYHAGPTGDTIPAMLERYAPWPNAVLWGIEMCHMDWNGRYTEASIKTARELGVWLTEMGGFDIDKDILRHYDITGKYCPRLWVDHPADWVEFKQSIKQRMLAVACAGTEDGN